MPTETTSAGVLLVSRSSVLPFTPRATVTLVVVLDRTAWSARKTAEMRCSLLSMS